MPPIEQLSPSVVNKIAAGEVIERPASVVKELMENALDAGATRVDVAVEQGGIELVRVADNGGGIPAAELVLAVASHATSKIRSADDLFAVGTLGFRGEALASIAAVSRLVIRSRTAEGQAGSELEVNGGELRPIAPCGCPTGTVVEVRHLFFNTPVRRKFLRTTQTEIGHTTEAFTRLALAHPHVHFTLRHQDRLLYELPPTVDWPGRLERFFGAELVEALIGIDNLDGQVRLSGYVADPSQSRANNRLQYLFLNGRHIRDRSLQHALSEAYRGLLLTGRFPICFLRLDMPPDVVDVNVHPTKLEVRFQDAGRLYSQLLGTLRTRFLTADLTARLQAHRARDSWTGQSPHDPNDVEQARRELVDWAKGELAQQTAAIAKTPDSYVAEPTPDGEPLTLTRLDPAAGTPWQPFPADEFTDEDEMPAFGTMPGGGGAGTPVRSALQVHNRYLVAEAEDGIVVIDQHALHERILYEQLREKVLGGALETQSLLVPEPVDLSPKEAAAVLDQRELLAQLGVRLEPFGGGTVLISSYPAMLAGVGPREVLRELVDLLVSDGRSPDRRDLIDSLLHMIACKAAIKAGDRLSPEEIAELVEQRHLAHDAHHCPHGRPTALVFTRAELDRQFKRI